MVDLPVKNMVTFLRFPWLSLDMAVENLSLHALVKWDGGTSRHLLVTIFMTLSQCRIPGCP